MRNTAYFVLLAVPAGNLVSLLLALGLSQVRVNMAGCLDRCEDGPCMVIYPEGVWYRIESTADVDAVLEGHVVRGERQEALMLPRETR